MSIKTTYKAICPHCREPLEALRGDKSDWHRIANNAAHVQLCDGKRPRRNQRGGAK